MSYGLFMNMALLSAAGLSLACWAVHTFVGGREVARPLLDAKMASVPKYTSYYCWHLVTIVLLAMTAAFAYGAVAPTGKDVAVFALGLSIAFSIWSLVLVVWKRQRLLQLPQWLLFLVISVVAAAGIA